MAEHRPVLRGFEPESQQPCLKYGDTISLIPEGVNGLAAFAGGRDGRAWIEILDDSVNIPPNLRDCKCEPPCFLVDTAGLEPMGCILVSDATSDSNP